MNTVERKARQSDDWFNPPEVVDWWLRAVLSGLTPSALIAFFEDCANEGEATAKSGRDGILASENPHQ